MKPADLRRRLQETGRSQAALAQHLGKSKDSVSRLVGGHRGMDVDELDAIKQFFGDDMPAAPAFVQIPVYGYAAAGGGDRISIASDQVLEHLEIPAGMARGEAFGVRVAGDSMSPRLFSGETVIVERNVPPVRNKEAVIELKDGSALVKEYRGQRDGQVFLWQYNPEEEVRVDASKVRAMHAVKYRR